MMHFVKVRHYRKEVKQVLVSRARCGRESHFSQFPLVVFARSIGKRTSDLNRREMFQFMSRKGGEMAFKKGDPPHKTKCEGCGIQGVMFTQIGGKWYCTASCALQMKGKGRSLGVNHFKRSSVTQEEIKMAKKRIKEERKKKRVEEDVEDREESTESQEESKKKKGKKKGLGEHLQPKEPVKFPKELLKHPEIGEALKTLTTADRSSREAAKARMKLRGKGFKLSEESTWKPFLKKVN